MDKFVGNIQHPQLRRKQEKNNWLLRTQTHTMNMHKNINDIKQW